MSLRVHASSPATGTLPPMVPGVLLLALLSATSSCSEDSKANEADAGAASDTGAVNDAQDNDPSIADEFTNAAATAICEALFRCCDSVDHQDYFAGYLANELLADYHQFLPPNAELTLDDCPTLVRGMLNVTPFGDWVEAVEDGRVAYDPGATSTCLSTLEQASCGDELGRALFESSCFGLAAPTDGRQRSMFERYGSDGDRCSPIRDGVGAAFYGSCNPETHFCCYIDDANPGLGCTYPFEGDGTPREGTCVETAAVGESCSPTAPLALCSTGNDCSFDKSQCVAPSSDILEVGDPCIDDGFNLLGECENSFCDVLGTEICEPLREDGGSCQFGYECTSGACVDQSCGESSFCSSPSGAMQPDPNGSEPDAGPMVSIGETCSVAYALESESIASSVAGFDFTVSRAVATTNNYNPLNTSGLEPGCSVVYDAVGFDTVYQVELEPGETISLRYSLVPNTAVGGIYLLDGCSPISWPDYDGSGACGSNEYKTDGFCGFLGCDPLDFSFTFPSHIDGVPTSTRVFWIVLDEVAGTNATSFQLDWRVN